MSADIAKALPAEVALLIFPKLEPVPVDVRIVATTNRVIDCQ